MKRYCDPSVSPSVCLSPGRAVALGYWHASCLQPSQVRTADPSADGRRSAASRTAISGGHIVPCTLSVHLCLQHDVRGGGNASRGSICDNEIQLASKLWYFTRQTVPPNLAHFPFFCHYTSTVARVISFSTVSVTTLFIMKI